MSTEAPHASHHHAADACCHGDHDHHHAPATAAAPAPGYGLRLRIPAMDCAAEESEIRAALDALPEIARLRFDLGARVLAVDAPTERWPAVTEAIEKAGFEAQPIEGDAAPDPAERRREMIRLAAALALACAAELLHFFAPGTIAWHVAGMTVAAVAIALAGTSVLRKGWKALLAGRLNINALMTVAVAGAFVIGQWPEAAMVMALYSLAELIEARAVQRARGAIASLLALAPAQAEVGQPDGTWALMDARAVPVGARVRVKPGERLALDGHVLRGRSAVNQAPVTGESLPVDKRPGDEVFAGTINDSGALEFEVTRPAGDTVLARIIGAVEDAQAQHAPTQRFVDRFAAVYTPAVFVLALAVALGGPWLAGWTWPAAVYKALVLLVIACPCALVISTPVTVVSGLAAAARRGILIKGGVYLEQARRLKTIALDKTGTLTRGEPVLVAGVAPDGAAPSAHVARIARGLAARSDHPVSKAIAAGLAHEPLPVDDFGAQPGRGVHGVVGGQRHVLGNHRWIEERGQCSPAVEAHLDAHQAQGRTMTLLAGENGVLALYAVADTVKDSSRQAVAGLKAMGIQPVMLTGDNPATARSIAAQVGIDRVEAELLPEDKLRAVERLAADGPVGMVGDGVNDSPSLAAAAIGFSMGGAGTDAAREAADVLIMDDDLRKVPETIRLSRRTHAVLVQNIALALGIKAVFLLLALRGDASMWMAVFADMGASLLVVANGLRLLRWRG
ncbi:heavy metal translocating P-type ATPase [Ottowia sp.]|uniref:heavy metal translocating P-type ATPase n=1 Tax=Ottowia sp. TaxID=1898956 RepID=UPI0039E332AE